MIYRPLLLARSAPSSRGARGVPVRSSAPLYLLALALSVALCALTIGVDPQHRASRRAGRHARCALTKRPATAILTAALLGMSAIWLGIVLAYDSFYWPPKGQRLARQLLRRRDRLRFSTWSAD